MLRFARDSMMIAFLAALTFLSMGPTAARAEEIIFLQDGRIIRAEKTEVIGDQIRIEKPAETFELPRSAVLSIHTVPSPSVSPNVPPPADVYRDMTQQMNEKVRRELQEHPGKSGGR